MDCEKNGLIALDFDGTSAVYEPQLALHPDCLHVISAFQGRGYGWVINSDRYTDTLLEIAHALPAGLRPDGILSAQRFIHTRTEDGGYEPVQKWNDSRLEMHDALWGDISPFFKDWQQEIELEFAVCERYIDEHVFAYRVPAEENAALHKRMRGYIQPWPKAQLSGNHEWSFILHADFSKASLLEHYCMLNGMDTKKIIAVGDGFNDISMLDAGLTPYTGCPADAGQDVIAAVRAGGGYVAGHGGPQGTIEILRHYLEILAV